MPPTTNLQHYPDFDKDGDVDGLDLAVFAGNGTGTTLEKFARDFGCTDCAGSGNATAFEIWSILLSGI